MSTENPNRLALYIRGIGFVTADAIAMKLGIEKTALVRVRAGIGHALAGAMEEGHSGLPEEELGPLAAKLLEVPAELIRTALDLEHADGTAVISHGWKTRPVSSSVGCTGPSGQSQGSGWNSGPRALMAPDRT